MPEYAKLAELVAADPKLKSRVVIAKVGLKCYTRIGVAASRCGCWAAQQVHGRLVWTPGLTPAVVYALATQADADAHRSLGEKFGVQGFPTIKYLAPGKAPTQENAVE